MGNEISSFTDTSQEKRSNTNTQRSPFSAIENQQSYPTRFSNESKFPETKSFREGSKKRTRTHFTQTQPAGSQHRFGTMGIRWPITGVNSDCIHSQGTLNLVSLSDQTDECVIYWCLNLREYIEKLQQQSDDYHLPRLVSSSVFRHHPMGSRLRWKLTIAPKDIDDDSLSIYLENENSRAGELFEVDCHFSLFLAAGEVAVDSTTLIRHCFSAKQPTWGIQSFVTFRQILNHIKKHELTVGLILNWVRDSRLFPPQFAIINSHNPELYKLCDSPKIMMMEHFLSMNECEALIKKASPHLYRSRVASGSETPSRTSSSMFFTGKLEKHEVVKSFYKKLLDFINRPEINEGRNIKPTESLQAVRYNIGEFYSEHYDNKAGMSDMRAATLIVYLRDTDAGGATCFPRASKSLLDKEVIYGSWPSKQELRKDGLRIFPRQGRALFFWSRLPDGHEDKNALHAAEPIIEGEKWIATHWLREFDTSS